MKKLKNIPKFKSEAEERKFWQNVDSTEYVDYSKGLERWRFPNLKLSTKPITIRLPESLIERIKLQAHKMDVPYQSYIKQLLFESMNISNNKSKNQKFMVFDKGYSKYLKKKK